MTSSTDSGTLHSRSLESFGHADGLNHVELWMVSLILGKELNEISRRRDIVSIKLMALAHGVTVQTIYRWRKIGYLEFE